MASSRDSAAASTLPMSTRPESGRIRVAATASNEDFPEPDGPVIPVTTPASARSVTWSTAVTRELPSGKVRVTSSRVIIGCSRVR
ncbi:hypothetical protein ASG04_06205 [Curtobacterium sp. Leaf183]|nr:hypothetical protein ASG04_06205 [Curtobacterium sp. Leaf183]